MGKRRFPHTTGVCVFQKEDGYNICKKAKIKKTFKLSE